MKSALAALLTLSTIALLPIPIRECSVCCGVAKRLQAQGVHPEQARTNCPSCRDRGRVSLLRSALGRKIDPRLCAMIQDDPHGTWQSSYFSSLSLLGQDLGDLPWMYAGRARFTGLPGDECLVALAELTSYPIPGSIYTHCWLFDTRGNLLDYVESSRSSREAGLGAEFVHDSLSDSAVIRMDAKRARFVFWEGGKKLLIRDDPRNGTCRLVVRDRRFRVLP